MNLNRGKNNLIGAMIIPIILIIITPIIAIIIVESPIISKASNEGWLGFIGNYFGGILGAIMSVGILIASITFQKKIQEREYKSKNRCIFDINEFYNRGIDIKGIPIKKDTKLIETTNYIEIKKYAKEHRLTPSLNYVRIVNLGPGLAMDIYGEIKYKREDQTKRIDFYIPAILETEEIFVNVDFLQWALGNGENERPAYMESIVLKYKTCAIEEMKYESYKLDESRHIDNIYYKESGKYKEYFTSQGKSTAWYIIRKTDE